MTPSEYQGLFDHEETLWWFVGMRRLLDTLLQGRTRAGMRTLDAACGAGYTALYQARQYGWHVFPCDLSWHALEFSARRRVPRLVCADVARLPYADSVFDVVTCFDMLVMLRPEQLDLVLAEFRRVLAPGGILVTRVAALEALRGRHSYLNGEARRYELEELCGHHRRAGFTIERGIYANAILLPALFIKRRIFEPLRLMQPDSDVQEAPAFLNRLFLGIMDLERRMIATGWNPPLGTSTVIVSRKKQN